MTMNRLLVIVEGEGDMKAVPLLVRKVLELHELFDVTVLHPQRRGELPKVLANFENWYRVALKERASILWVVDYDCDDCTCVARHSDQLRQRASAIFQGWPFEVCLMNKEFETLFLADPKATRSVLRKIPEDIAFPSDPESIRGAKEWLSKAMPNGFAYKPTVHQDKIAAALNLDHLRETSPSFAHLERALIKLAALPMP